MKDAKNIAGFRIVRPEIGRAFGANAMWIYSELANIAEMHEGADGWFYATREMLEAITGLSRTAIQAAIDKAQLLAKTASNVTVSITATDGTDTVYKDLTVNVFGNNAPTLSGGAALSTISEDVISTSNPGSLVSDLLASRFTDTDVGHKFAGIAVGIYFIAIIIYLVKTAVIPITVAGEWRTVIDVIAVATYLIAGLPLIWIALQELNVVNRGLDKMAKLKIHAICVALFLVFGHIAMIAGMLDPAILGYDSSTMHHGHKGH